jgi:hypothetical protein
MVNVKLIFIILCYSVKCIKQEWHRTHDFKIEQALKAESLVTEKPRSLTVSGLCHFL